MKTMNPTVIAVGILIFAGALFFGVPWGPDQAPWLDTRTYTVEHLQAGEVSDLLDPYVYEEREGAPGAISMMDGAISVRETRDNLERIERVLEEFDKPKADIRLVFQLIEADGFTDSDPRIAGVEDQLRKLFDFRGYRLAGEATVTASNYTDIEQQLTGADGAYRIAAGIFRMGPDVTRVDDVSLMWGGQRLLATSVNVRTGQTIVLGSSPKAGSSATLFLTVRGEPASGPS